MMRKVLLIGAIATSLLSLRGLARLGRLVRELAAPPMLAQILPGTAPQTAPHEAIDAYLAQHLRRLNVPGAAVGVISSLWGPSTTVGEDVVGRLYGSMLDQRADRAYLVTTARVSTPARRWIGTKPIEIWDATGLLANWSGQISRLPDPKDRSPAPQGGRPTPPDAGRRRQQRSVRGHGTTGTLLEPEICGSYSHGRWCSVFC
jgi:hypothetical protein